MLQLMAYVAVSDVAYHFDILYSYIVPEELSEQCKKGCFVQIPFGRGTAQRQGVVFALERGKPQGKLKKIIRVLDEAPVLNDRLLELAKFIKERTFSTLFEAVKVQLPAGFNLKFNVTYVALADTNETKISSSEQAVYDYLLETGVYMSYKEMTAKLGDFDPDILYRLLSKGLVHRNYSAVKKIGNISTRVASLCTDVSENDYKLTEKQSAVVKVLKDTGSCSVKELCYFTGVTAAVVSALEKKGIIKIENEEVYRIPDFENVADTSNRDIVLNDEQQSAYDGLVDLSTKGGTALLYGVTGSGKTSVFMKLIDKVLSDGKEIIVMVPEIALTPQLMKLFKARYGSNVAIFHSALSVGERKDEYRRVVDKKVKIVIGTRSAVFAPFENLGLIVIDEEQEHTYKSESSPRYHARDIARYRVAQSKALLVLSSATPSLESYSYAKSGKYAFFELTKRYGEAVLPDVTLVDLKTEQKRGNRTNFSFVLQDKIRANLDEGKQTVLLMNRRGYNTFAACGSCGKVVSCPNCSVSLTYHSANGRLMCHYCGYSEPLKKECPDCGEPAVRYAGTGTQKIELEIGDMFPGARILRLDTDSVSSRKDYENGLRDFSLGKYDIMLGTQMVAKGLDFENVTLVGVINADTQLNDDDYRSQENTFDLLTQVVGRAGRGNKKGSAVIQTTNPENNVINLAREQDYKTFYNTEISIRKSLIYPPFCDLCVLLAVSENEHVTYNIMLSITDRIRQLCNTEYSDLKIIILPPMPPRIAKVNNKYRNRIIIKTKNTKRFRAMISQLLIEFGNKKEFSSASLYADINPENLS